jgi:hypothetical protein
MKGVCEVYEDVDSDAMDLVRPQDFHDNSSGAVYLDNKERETYGVIKHNWTWTWLGHINL